MNLAKRIAGAALAVASVAQAGWAATPAAPERPLTLSEAIASALEKNETIIISRHYLDSAEQAVSGARGAYDPLLEVDGGWRRASIPVNSAFSGAPDDELASTTEGADAGVSVTQRFSTGGEVSLYTSAARQTTDGSFTLLSPAYDTALGIAARQPLLRGRAVDFARSTIRVADTERDRSAALLKLDVMETVTAVERAYWTLVALRDAVGVREEAVRLAEDQLEETRVRIDNGVSPDTEIAQPRAELERRRGDLLATREAVSRAQNRLKVLILAEADAELWSRAIVPVERAEVEAVDLDVEAAIERALASRPELDAALAVERRRAIEREFASDETKPSLDAVVSYDRYGLAGSLNPSAEVIPGFGSTPAADLVGDLGRSYGVLGDGELDDVRAGLVLSIPIGNRTAKAATAIARNAERQAAAAIERTRKTVRAEVLDAAAAVDTAYQRVEAARAALDAARTQLEAEQDRFDAGLSTNFLVLTRQNDLEGRRIDEIATRTEYLNARTELARASGSLLDERGIEIAESASSSETGAVR